MKYYNHSIWRSGFVLLLSLFVITMGILNILNVLHHSDPRMGWFMSLIFGYVALIAQWEFRKSIKERINEKHK